MSTLNEEMAAVQAEIEEVRTLLREELPTQFDFDVRVGKINYDPNSNSISVRVDPSSEARSQLSEAFGGVKVRTEGSMEFHFTFTHSNDTDA